MSNSFGMPHCLIAPFLAARAEHFDLEAAAESKINANLGRPCKLKI
jgi:hypothetical protein